MLNMTIVNMVSSVISDIEWLQRYNFSGITVFDSNAVWIHSPEMGNVELRLYYGTKIGPEMVGKNIYYEEVINLPESVYKRLMALCKDLAGEARPYISGITTDDDEPSSVGLAHGITEDTDKDVITVSSVGVRPGWHTSVEDTSSGLNIEDVKDPYEVVGVPDKNVNPCFSPLPWGDAKEVAYILRRFRREVINEILPVVKTEEEYEKTVKSLWREEYAHEYYRFVR